jgi:hypothetical protein
LSLLLALIASTQSSPGPASSGAGGCHGRNVCGMLIGGVIAGGTGALVTKSMELRAAQHGS